MKVALMLCPQWDTEFPTYSSALLTALLKRRGHEVGFFDLNVALDERCRTLGLGSGPEINVLNPWTDREFVEGPFMSRHGAWFEGEIDKALAQGYRTFGFSVFFSNAVASGRAAALIKRKDPGAVVVFGGPLTMEAGFRRRILDELPDVDAVIPGEADASLPDFVDALEESGRLSARPGVVLRGGGEGSGGAEAFADLDALPFADYGGHALASYGNRMSIHSCRGCVRRCTFCTDWRLMTYRQMSGRRMFDEVVHQLRVHPEVRDFLFADSLVNGDMKNLDAFCDLLLRSGVRTTWQGYAIVRPQMTPSFLAKMAAAGCRCLFYGVESGSQDLLNAMKKGTSVELNAKVLHDTTAAGIRTVMFWIVGHPAESERTFSESLRFLEVNARAIGDISTTLFSLQGDDSAPPDSPGDHHLFWTGSSGSNSFPVRIERLRRVIRTASDLGIPARLEGKFDAAETASRCGTLLEAYRRHRAREAATQLWRGAR
ncbi:MAG: B12-binding domain-containing radical SAM protein [Elusimicrobiota bacterium]